MGVGSQEQVGEERCVSTFSTLIAIRGVALGLAVGTFWLWGLGQSNKVVEHG